MCVCVCVCVHIEAYMFRLALVLFYDISTTVGCLIPNPFNIYITYMIPEHILYIIFLNKPALMYFST